jgi:hypothetical protein
MWLMAGLLLQTRSTHGSIQQYLTISYMESRQGRVGFSVHKGNIFEWFNPEKKRFHYILTNPGSIRER